ncbi:MAG: D-lysine 5,6-aminomutase subunit alpha [Candidatus Delongbacteria bacterium]|nr:D-lysine 5,6-aminomutase subunit alpha [Candidatus Delongbacteria bacterium]
MWSLPIDTCRIETARALAASIVSSMDGLFRDYSTVSTERAVLRLLGVDGIDGEGVPWPNRIVEELRESGKLSDGVMRVIAGWGAALNLDPMSVVDRIRDGEVDLNQIPPVSETVMREHAESWVRNSLEHLKKQAERRHRMQAEYPNPHQPKIYVIVATGNIYEDLPQARAAVRQGADIIAVIRSTAQSLLDYVPYGATTEGFGGTYATQENFRIMRQGLDDLIPQEGRYIYLANYASGLCMPEMAAMAAMERLDILLNDALYGILFRDINPKRTLLDQYFSRMINAYSGILINTGEDNYLTTSDAIEKAHTVTASQLINEQFALRSGLPPSLMGLGHAFEINPEIPDSFVYELSHALLARTLFPESPLKYMPPTKHMDGNIFRTFMVNLLFDLAGKMSNQSILLLGMLTEAIHTPFLQDRSLAITGARYVISSTSSLADQFDIRPDSFLVRRANQVLEETITLLEQVDRIGLFQALQEGAFAEIKRPPDHGKGLEGVFRKSSLYWNPFLDHFPHSLPTY